MIHCKSKKLGAYVDGMYRLKQNERYDRNISMCFTKFHQDLFPRNNEKLFNPIAKNNSNQ